MTQHPSIGEILVRAGIIDDFQLRSALGEQKRWGGRLGVTLVKMGFAEEWDLTRALAEQMDLPIAQLEGKRIHQDVLDLVPGDFAEKHMCLPLFVKREGKAAILHVGVEDPGNLEVFDDLRFRTGMRVKPVMVMSSELCEAIDRFYRGVATEPFAEVEDRSLEKPVSESELRGSPEPDLAFDEDEALSFVGAVPASQAEEPAAGAKAEASNRVILRALTQILIEKEIIGRDELYNRVRALQDSEEL